MSDYRSFPAIPDDEGLSRAQVRVRCLAGLGCIAFWMALGWAVFG